MARTTTIKLIHGIGNERVFAAKEASQVFEKRPSSEGEDRRDGASIWLSETSALHTFLNLHTFPL